MAIQKIFIRDLISEAKGKFILDVRSPAEFRHAHFPGAINLPLFSDDERRIIGTAYKQESRETAVRLGLDFFAPRMKSMIDDVIALMDKEGAERTAPVYVYCWRGGMRSGAVSWLLDLYGFKVKQLSGGYKSFRRWTLAEFEKPYVFHILGGYTGSGKTELLQEMSNRGEKTIDLEQIAGHKGSAFGNLSRTDQPTQEMFENLLALALDDTDGAGPGSRVIWLEDESQRIGLVNIPSGVWQKMRKAPVFFLDIPFEERLKRIVEEYGVFEKQLLLEATERISKRLGGLETKNAITFLEEGNVREAFAILLHYYDKKYLKSLHNREAVDHLVTSIRCEQVSAANAERLVVRELSAS